MGTNKSGFQISLGKPVAALFILLAGLALAVGVCLSIEIIPLALGIALLVLLVATSRLNTTNLLIAYIVADHLCQFLKRAIFLLGPQPMLVYWGFQLLPTLVLGLAVLASLYSLRKTRFPLSAKLLAVFIAISLAQAFFSPNGSTLVNRLAGVNQSILPLFAAFAGMALPPRDWRRVAKLLLILIVVSSIYGVFQLVHGPTFVDRTWALQTGDYSTEGLKVFKYVTGASADFRPYAYYADPSSWGFFLILGTLFIAAARQRTSIPPAWLKVAAVFALIGMVAVETRTVWIALAGALLIHWVLSSRALRRPIVVITGIVTAFGLVLSIGQYAMDHWGERVTSNYFLHRYMTVGTISARTSALKIFIRVLPTHLFLGEGYGTPAGSGLETFNFSSLRDSEYYSHNAIVSLLLSVGLPGLLAFGAFLYRWSWESLRTINLSPAPIARSQLWIVAACVGLLFTGPLTGPLFLNSTYFTIFLGLAMGETIRWRQRVEAERSLLAGRLKHIHGLAMEAREVSV